MSEASAISLDDLGKKFGTDKSSRDHDGHGYLEFYEKHIKKWKEFEIKILDIGLYHGGSLKVWNEYFLKAKIIGLDCDWTHIEKFPKEEFERVELFYGNQRRVEDLWQLAGRYGPFDLVIDDGSHRADDQIRTFITLWPHVLPGGIYIMEDIVEVPSAKFVEKLDIEYKFYRESLHAQGTTVLMQKPGMIVNLLDPGPGRPHF